MPRCCAMKYFTTAILVLAACLASLLVHLPTCHGQQTVHVCSPSLSVNTTDTDCESTIDQALHKITSNTHLLLSPGSHRVEEFLLHRAVENVSLVGLGPPSEVVITCEDGVGLAFFGAHGLSLQNLTIEGCGMSGLPNWSPVLTAINETFGVTTIQFPQNGSVKVGLLLGDCAGVTLSHVTITNTSGIGLLAINVVGTSSLSDVSFLGNSPPKCNPQTLEATGSLEWIGGGAYFLYEDYAFNFHPPTTRVAISNAVFAHNRDCGVVGLPETIARFSKAIQQIGYSIGAGGGLSIMLTQELFPIEFEVESILVHDNVAKFGAGLHIAHFDGVKNCHIGIKNSRVDRNGGFTYSGGGVMVFVDLFKPEYDQLSADLQSCSDPTANNFSVVVTDTKFTSNKAVAGGGWTVFSHCGQHATLQMSFNRCRFEHNFSPEGPAMLFIELKFSSFGQGLQVDMCDCTFAHNVVDSRDDLRAVDYEVSGVVQAISTSLVICGDSQFIDNRGTALASIRSTIYAQGNILFARNQGINGGALILSDISLLVVKRDSSVEFINNSASIAGGAIYAELLKDSLFVYYDDCFLYLDEYDPLVCTTGFCSGEELNISITFSGNTALTGSIVYGSTLETCPWGQALRDADPNYNASMTFWEYLHWQDDSMFTFDQIPVGADRVSTITSKLAVSGGDVTKVMPGQTFTVQVEALDLFSQSVTTGITSQISKSQESLEALSRVGASGYWFLDGSSGTVDAPITVTGDRNQTIQVTLLSIGASVFTELTVELSDCLAGFVYNQANRSCICEGELMAKGLGCDINTRSLTVPDNTWVGPIEESESGKPITEDQNPNLVVHDCVFDYCEPGEKDITIADYNLQCASGYHRAGLLCGECEEGYSIQLSSSRCNKCSHYYLFLLVFFGASGIVLVSAMILLRITIAEGYLNGILFYSNIVSLFTFEFAPGVSGSAPLFITSFLSLNFGLESCFYDGMTALARSGLQLVFVAYLYLLMGVMTLISRYVNLPGTKNYSPMKVFATLSVLSYVSVLQACLEILSPVIVETLGGKNEVRWYVDPTVRYFVGVHGLLGAVAICLILIYIIPLPIFGLFPRVMYSMKYTRYLKPLYDALWAPFEPKFRFWLGLRLILRWLPFTFAYYLLVPHKLFALGFFLLVLFCVQTTIRPFQGFWRNLLDELLIANSISLVLGSLYFSNDDRQTLYSGVIVAFAYLIFVGVIVIHVFLRFRSLREMRTQLMSRIKSRDAQSHRVIKRNVRPGVTVVAIDSEWSNGSSFVQSPPDTRLQSSNFEQRSVVELRESLLEERNAAAPTATKSREGAQPTTGTEGSV